jgi:hypothetical protein
VNVDKKVENLRQERKECVHARFCLSLVAQKLIRLSHTQQIEHTEGENLQGAQNITTKDDN